MKFTLSWLKDHLDTDASLDAIGKRLTAIGLELEGIEDRAKDLAPFKVAYVMEASPHPNADRLRVCLVDTGTETVQVVCGAPNARTGMKGVFAPAGTYIPGTGIELKKGVIRGAESNGMLVSEREMGLSQEHDGIIELPADAPIGRPFAEVLGLNDPVIDVALTPNRADCAGIHGIARDLAAAGLGTLKPLDTAAVPGAFASPLGVLFDFPAGKEQACPLFVGRYFRGVRNGPSPKWLQDRLRALKLRPISALVDITNYLTFDVNRPLHVFDADKVRGGMLTVRMAGPGERIAALNGKEYELDQDVTVIADEEGVESLGGVMGGQRSGCSPETVNVFLECALFDPIRTAQTGRRLAIESDARYRFERGVDPAFVVPGMELATRLILELCGGEGSELVVTGSAPEWRRTISLRPERVSTLGGIELPQARQRSILEALGFEVSDGGGSVLNAVPPSWRGDIEGEADLVEEIVRIHGYDEIPAVLMPRTVAVTRPAVSAAQRRAVLVKRALAARGMDEAVTWSFMPSKLAALFREAGRNADPESMILVNPISADLDAMRPSVLPNLIQAAGRNGARGYADVALFEVGPAYRDVSPDGQDLVAAGVRAGTRSPRHWSAPARQVDALDAKADAIAVLEAAGAPTANLQTVASAPAWYHPGRAGELKLGPNVLARFGEIHPETLQALDVGGPIVAFEVFPGRIPAAKKKGGTAKPLLKLSSFQPVRRDFAFVVEAKVETEAALRAVRSADKTLIADVAVFDVYTGPGIDAGKKSLAITVTIQPSERTLTDEEIEGLAGRIVAAVKKHTGAVLRG